MKRSVPLGVCFGLAVAVVLDTLVQVFWKAAVSAVPEYASVVDMVAYMVRQPLVWLVVVLFLTQLLNWLKVLGRADLSFAQPITSLSYISVCILSVMFLHESVGLKEALGIALILGGVWFVSRGEHHTTSEVAGES